MPISNIPLSYNQINSSARSWNKENDPRKQCVFHGITFTFPLLVESQVLCQRALVICANPKVHKDYLDPQGLLKYLAILCGYLI